MYIPRTCMITFIGTFINLLHWWRWWTVNQKRLFHKFYEMEEMIQEMANITMCCTYQIHNIKCFAVTLKRICNIVIPETAVSMLCTIFLDVCIFSFLFDPLAKQWKHMLSLVSMGFQESGKKRLSPLLTVPSVEQRFQPQVRREYLSISQIRGPSILFGMGRG